MSALTYQTSQYYIPVIIKNTHIKSVNSGNEDIQKQIVYYPLNTTTFLYLDTAMCFGS